MTCLLQVDFPYDGPWGDAMAQAMTGLALSIADEPGLLWKIWTENQERGEAGGIYLFADAASALAYLEMHSERLRQAGIVQVNGKVFEVNSALSRLDRAPL